MQRKEYLRHVSARWTPLRAIEDSTSGAGRIDSMAIGSACDGIDSIPKVEFYSPASQVAPDQTALTDPSVVAVWAEPSATNADDDGNADAYRYDSDAPIPLVSVDSGVYGFGAILLQDGDIDFDYGNEEFVLNAWDAEMGGSGTVLYDEGHGQYTTLSDVSKFRDYAESNGYTVKSTSNLASDLSDADAVVVTSPSTAFSSSELDALADFVNDGGALFVHDESDYNDYDGTQHLNDVAERLDLAFRFNDDDVNDDRNNAGGSYDILTSQFNATEFDLFADREGIGLNAGVRYEALVTDVADGDTVDVALADGTTAEIRTLGIDTAETEQNSEYEETQGWEGIEDADHLTRWGEKAKQFAKDELRGETVEVELDPKEDVWDPFGRLLAYIHYDRNGDGSLDTLYNEEMVRRGYARVYGSNLSKHDQFWQAERDARDAGRGVWQASDPANTPEVRDDGVERVFVPNAASVRTTDGTICSSRVPVFAESTATQDLTEGVKYSDSDVPLVGVDSSNRIALVGGLSIDEEHRQDVTDHEHEVFLTNLADSLSDRSGKILVEGGHGQFNESYSLSSEDAVGYQRYLEGQDVGFEQVNDLTTSGDNGLSTARAVFVSAPRSCYTASEVEALTEFTENGGAVVLLGAGYGKISPDTRRNFNGLASALGTDLRLNADRVLDAANNVGDDPELLSTANTNTSDFSLWSSYS